MPNVTCDNKDCTKEFNKYPYQIKKTNANYCSRSCAVSENNRKYPKRSLQGGCKNCDKLISSDRTYCSECWDIKVQKRIQDDSLLSEVIYTRHHKSSAFAKVRTRARAIADLIGLDSCLKCGYNRHIEICHKPSISSYPLNTPLNVINDPKNLYPLCPTHHWEFDNGYLDDLINP